MRQNSIFGQDCFVLQVQLSKNSDGLDFQVLSDRNVKGVIIEMNNIPEREFCFKTKCRESELKNLSYD